MRQFLFLISISLVLMTSCSRRYSNTSYDKHPIHNKTIAILPYEVVTTGRIPDEITDEILEEIEIHESVAFQSSLYHQILDRLDSRRYRHIQVSVQAYSETNRRIEAAGYTIQDSWSLPSNQVADLLGVDAVMRSHVHKTQYLTDLESFGIHMAQRAIDILSGFNQLYYYGPRNLESTSDVRISSTIIDRENGATLWAASRRHPTNWQLQTQDAIERINYRISRSLPR